MINRIRKNISNFFKYRKRVWIPLFFGLFFLAVNIFAARYAALVFGLTFQGLYLVAFMAIQVVVWIVLFFYVLASRIKVTLLMPGDLNFTWEDYRGQPELVRRAKTWVDILKGVREFEAMGGEYQAGMLFEGPPGGGKTYLAKVIASEAGIPFLSVETSSLMGTFIGIGPLKVSGLFRRARNLADEYGACILFLDEIDAIGGARGGMAGSFGSGAHPMPMMGGMAMGGGGLLNTLLIELDGLQEGRSRLWKFLRRLRNFFGFSPPRWDTPRLMVIGSTNRPDVLDPALTRPGRLGLRVHVDLPDFEGQKDICQYYITRYQHDETLTADLVAYDAMEETPAFIRQTLNNAALMAFADGERVVGYRHWVRAFSETKMSGLRQPTKREPDELRHTAVHEAAHAALMWHLYPRDRYTIKVATIVRYGAAGGHVAPQKTRPWKKPTVGEARKSLIISLGGVIAEEVFFGDRGIYPSMFGDMRSAQSYVLELAREGVFGWRAIAYGEETPKEILNLASEELERAAQEAHDLIAGTLREPIERLANALMEKEEIYGEEVIRILEGKEERAEVPLPLVVGASQGSQSVSQVKVSPQPGEEQRGDGEQTGLAPPRSDGGEDNESQK
ncbi:MAG: AAA family ATPase [Chloroflexi bacterium]|nr:AAA family ATPase [Chloroflexota bacterium]